MQIGDGQRGRLGGHRAAARDRLQARQQLGEGERLHQVVVATRLQPLHAVVDAVAGAEEQHRRGHLGAAQRRHQAEPVETRQHHVDHRGVVGGGPRQLEPGDAVGGDVHRVPFLPQSRRHELGDAAVVFHDQHPHDAIVVRAAESRQGGRAAGTSPGGRPPSSRCWSVRGACSRRCRAGCRRPPGRQFAVPITLHGTALTLHLSRPAQPASRRRAACSTPVATAAGSAPRPGCSSCWPPRGIPRSGSAPGRSCGSSGRPTPASIRTSSPSTTA